MSSNDKKQNSDNLPERMGQSEPAASSELAQRPQHLPEKVGHSATTISIANMACKPLPEFEAELTIELDRISELGDRDPLAALDNIIAMMQGLNLEIVKNIGPPLIENFQLRNMEFGQTGKMPEMGRSESRALVSFHRTQEATVKLGAARVKVRDERDRRQNRRIDPGNVGVSDKED